MVVARVVEELEVDGRGGEGVLDCGDAALDGEEPVGNAGVAAGGNLVVEGVYLHDEVRREGKEEREDYCEAHEGGRLV